MIELRLTGAENHVMLPAGAKVAGGNGAGGAITLEVRANAKRTLEPRTIWAVPAGQPFGGRVPECCVDVTPTHPGAPTVEYAIYMEPVAAPAGEPEKQGEDGQESES